MRFGVDSDEAGHSFRLYHYYDGIEVIQVVTAAKPVGNRTLAGVRFRFLLFLLVVLRCDTLC